MRIAAGVLVIVLASTSASAQSRYPALNEEAACQTLMPAAAGGPLPRNPDVLVLRFLGVSNYELAYRDTVILLDAAIDKLAWWAPNNITPEEMTRRVNAILIGHAHGTLELVSLLLRSFVAAPCVPGAPSAAAAGRRGSAPSR